MSWAASGWFIVNVLNSSYAYCKDVSMVLITRC
uniref:Uncharacterized protein n=1 Tax=Anguilla anguilla TaxID=7936 RepID=A0A0E9T9N2_ANGAN